jgi:alkanesulfonate monooxygenase SsuD/methylene tetrahydromethanopterin reductase-like flavin-dependent oxidoreductase (luciferase family)
MRIGLQVPSFTWPGGPAAIAAKLTGIARAAEDAGFYSLWVMDHYFQITGVGPPENDMLECYSTLGYLAAVTRRVKLGPMAVGVN